MNATVNSYKQAANAALSLGLAQANLGQSGFALFFALRNAPPLLQALVGGFAALGSALSGAVALFEETDKAAIRLRVSLAHVKTSLTAEDVLDYAQARERATGIDDAATIALANQLTQLNFNKEAVMGLIPLLQDLSAARPDLGDPAALASQIHRSLTTNRAQGLVNLGLDAQGILKLRTEAERLDEIMKELRSKVGGTSELMDPLGVSRLAAAWHELGKTVGDIIAPWIVMFNQLARGVLNFFGAIASGVKTGLEFVGIPTGSTQAARAVETAAKENGWKPEQVNESLKAQRETATNTKRLIGALERGFLGGGPIAQGVLGARNLNQAIRAAR